MSVLKYFKTIPGRPMGATCPKCNFFSSNLQRSPWRKKGGPVAHPSGDRPLSPVGGATGSCVSAWPTKPIEFHKIPPASEDLL